MNIEVGGGAVRVCLVNPPHPYLTHPDAQPPLGLLYVAAAAREVGHEVVLANLSRHDEGDALKHIPQADLYGFTATSIDYAVCGRIALRLKEERPGAVCVLGGPHAVVRQYIDFRVWDAACLGEGEAAIVRMCEDAERGELKALYSLPRATDLDGLPYPARDLMDVHGGAIFGDGRQYADAPSTVISSSRGCPFRCAFCASQAMWGRRVERRSPLSVAREVKRVVKEFGIRLFRFSDETFNLDRRWLAALCRLIEPLGVFWRCSIRAGLSLADDFKRMYDAGCRDVSIGLESGDQSVLNRMRKGTTVPQTRDAANLAMEAGITARLLIMAGCPGETKTTPEMTRAFLKSTNFGVVSMTQFRPLPGSEIWEWPERFGCRILDRDFSNYNVQTWVRGEDGPAPAPVRSVIETDEMRREDLEDNIRRTRAYALETGKMNRG